MAAYFVDVLWKKSQYRFFFLTGKYIPSAPFWNSYKYFTTYNNVSITKWVLDIAEYFIILLPGFSTFLKIRVANLQRNIMSYTIMFIP
jgi:hypothetical protein